ncbi:spore germination protein [Paenibacillus sp. FSL H7-0326]|uniref:spore germination protein n=1 Tax=Paenibacillus sp. FSL H7-0326 TaxID=1921144 RepID=UPI0009FA9614|nr:spore germination protein [Paenibacillus sp. FSL H7-0326]
MSSEKEELKQGSEDQTPDNQGLEKKQESDEQQTEASSGEQEGNQQSNKQDSKESGDSDADDQEDSKPSGDTSSNEDKAVPELPQLKLPIVKDLKSNLEVLQEVFKDCSDFVFREIKHEGYPDVCLSYLEGIVISLEVQDHIILPLVRGVDLANVQGASEDIELEKVPISLSHVKKAKTWREAADGVTDGCVLVLVEDNDEALLFDLKGGLRRSVQEPQTEGVVRGPREGFTEMIRANTGLIRFKLKTPMLKMENFTLGTETKTSVVLAYIKGIACEELIDDVRQRIKKINIDGVLESGYIEELIEDHPYSPFPQLHYTERPDTVVANLLEGRFCILVDGTPFALLGPVTMWQMLQASEDYYERFFISNFLRWIRLFFMMVALFLPALYIAITTFHQDMLPTTLIISIAAAREAIPFPALVEAMLMEISFEALREAGVRLPKAVGQAVSILGALVIGQAAVTAGIVSAPMVIIVSMTGIASFTIPRFNFAITLRLLRFPIMILAGTLGLFGIVIGTVLISAHLTQLTSFGQPYLLGVSPYRKGESKDIIMRVPWWKMIFKPSSTPNHERKRMDKGMNGSPNSDEGW